MWTTKNPSSWKWLWGRRSYSKYKSLAKALLAKSTRTNKKKRLQGKLTAEQPQLTSCKGLTKKFILRVRTLQTLQRLNITLLLWSRNTALQINPNFIKAILLLYNINAKSQFSSLFLFQFKGKKNCKWSAQKVS